MGGYDGFISYSHAADQMLAPTLQRAVQRYATPWYRWPSPLRIFRDQTGLSASPHLWTSIVEALDSSRFFVLLSSPDAARSEWVGKEIEHWVKRNGTERILPVVTDGVWVWDSSAGDFDWGRSTCAHRALSGVFREEPRHVNMTWARSSLQLDHRDSRFLDAVADIAAPLHGVPKDELAGEEVRQHRRATRTAWSAGAALAVLVVVALAASIVAVGQRNEAQDQTRVARSQTLIAQSRGLAVQAIAEAPIRLDRSLLLGIEAVRHDRNSESTAALLTALAGSSHLSGLRPEFEGAVADLVASPDRDTLAVAHLDGRVRLHATGTFEVLDESRIDDLGQLKSVRYQTDGRRLYVYGDRGARLLSLPDLEPVGQPFTIGGADHDVLVDVAGDGKHIALALLAGKEIEVREVATGRTAAHLDVPCFNPSLPSPGVSSLGWSPGGDLLAVTCSNPNGATLVNPITGSVIGTFAAPMFAPSAFEFSPSGDRIAFGESTGVTIYDTATLERLATHTPDDDDAIPVDNVSAMTFSPDGQLLAIGGDDGSFKVWDLELSLFHAEPVGLGGRTEGLAFLDTDVTSGRPVALSSDVTFPHVVVGTQETVTEWDLLAPPGLAEPIGDGAPILGVSESGMRYENMVAPPGLRIVDAAGDVAGEIELASDAARVWPSPDDRYLAVERWTTGKAADGSTVLELYRVSDGALVSDLSAVLGGVARLVFSPDDRWLAARTFDNLSGVANSAAVVATSDGHVVARPQVEPDSVMRWSGDGSLLVTGGASGALRMWDVDDGFRRRSDLKLVDSISGLAPVGDTDQMVVTVPTPGELWVVDLGDGHLTGQPFTSVGLGFAAGVMSPDGRVVAAFSPDGLQLWDAATRAVIGPAIPDMLGSGGTGFFGEGPFFTAPDVLVLPTSDTPLELRLDVDHWVEVACRLAARQLTKDEWRQYLPGERYAPGC